jgi:pyruvate kinase
MRRTKIVATVGPASEKEEVIIDLLKAGVNVFRFNMKYGEDGWHNSRIKIIRENAEKLKLRVAILVDVPSKDFKNQIEDFDWLALSYLKGKEDVVTLKKRFAGKGIKVMAKIENAKAIQNLESIAKEADGLMVARGDLGRETPIEELAFFQKEIVNRARSFGKPVIVATEMLYSMTESPTPTRAEATDVANAVFDGTDALMLSEETALGKHPVEAVKVMDKIARFCENSIKVSTEVIKASNLTDILTETATKMISPEINNPARSIIVFTRGGTSAILMSRHRPRTPIIAISNNERVLNSLCLSFGVLPFFKKFDTEKYTSEDPIFDQIKKRGLLKSKDIVVIIHGDSWFGLGPANRLSIRTL